MNWQNRLAIFVLVVLGLIMAARTRWASDASLAPPVSPKPSSSEVRTPGRPDGRTSDQDGEGSTRGRDSRNHGNDPGRVPTQRGRRLGPMVGAVGRTAARSQREDPRRQGLQSNGDGVLRSTLAGFGRKGWLPSVRVGPRSLFASRCRAGIARSVPERAIRGHGGSLARATWHRRHFRAGPQDDGDLPGVFHGPLSGKPDHPHLMCVRPCSSCWKPMSRLWIYCTRFNRSGITLANRSTYPLTHTGDPALRRSQCAGRRAIEAIRVCRAGSSFPPHLQDGIGSILPLGERGSSLLGADA